VLMVIPGVLARSVHAGVYLMAVQLATTRRTATTRKLFARWCITARKQLPSMHAFLSLAPHGFPRMTNGVETVVLLVDFEVQSCDLIALSVVCLDVYSGMGPEER
jgi:hypothetical protein